MKTLLRATKAIDQQIMGMEGAYGGTSYLPLYNLQTWTGLGVSPETALNISTVYQCVRLLSKTFAAMPLHLYRRLDAGGRERATDHPLYRTFHLQPNPDMTSFVWRELLLSHVLTWGNFYSERVINGFGELELWPLRPDRMQVRWDANGRKEYTYVYPSGTRQVLPPEKVFHVPGMSSNGLVGFSPINLMRSTISLMRTAEEYGENVFRNGARPATVLMHPASLSAPAVQRLATQMEELRGSSNAGKTVVLEEGLTLKEVGFPPEDAEFMKTRLFQKREIVAGFGIPAHKVNDLEHATFCLPADADVLTVEGPQRIADVTPGTLVVSLDAEGRWTENRVVGSTLTGYDPVLTIRTTNRTLRANARHRVLARVRVEAAATAAVGGVAVAGGWSRVSWRTDWVQAGKLQVGDTILSLGRLPASGSEMAPTRRVTEGFAEFVGLLLGDGNVLFAGEKPVGVSIARADAARYMDHYRDVMRAEFTRRGHHPVSVAESGRATRFASASAARELDILGLTGRAHDKRVPGWVFRLTEQLRLAVLRGFVEADGSVSKQGRIEVSSCNRALLSGIRHLAMGAGIPVTNVRRYRAKSGSLNGHPVVPTGDQFTFTMSDPGANRRVGSHDPQDAARLEAGRAFDRKGRAYPAHGGAGFVPGATELSRIVSIEVGAVLEPVYDLEIENTHSFVADGVVVHNTNITEQNQDFISDGMMEHFVRFEQEAAVQLTPDEPDIFVEFDVDGYLRGDPEKRANALAVRWQHGTLSADEWRAMENENPVPDGLGQIYYVPVNYAAINPPATEAQPVAPTTSRETITESGSAPATPPVAPPQLTVVKSASEFRCPECNAKLAEFAAPGTRIRCSRCKVTRVAGDPAFAGKAATDPWADLPERIAAAMPPQQAPVVNFHEGAFKAGDVHVPPTVIQRGAVQVSVAAPQLPEPRPVTKTVVRDPKTNQITKLIEEPD